ncbi:SE1832 family protein [Macrococcus carouselicus]|uniref:SE1832 family protein n=1 Tax=Macrococcus carouselicus TaxID=69969 RepID=UPI001408663A|nr:SE1832 family protein [Macrococcus carouselicus]
MDLKYQLTELKEEYVRIQGDIEKVQSTGNAADKLEVRLIELEEEIRQVREQLN